MKYFVSYTRVGSSGLCEYEGMDQETILRLLTEHGATNVQFITEDAYHDALTRR